MPLRALIFDVDGTLAETERDGHRVAFNRAFDEAGLPWRWEVEEYGALLRVTGGKERLRAYLAARDPVRADSAAASQLIERLHRRKNAVYAEIVAGGAIRLRPGVARLLGAARTAGLALAIATTTSPENVRALVGSTLGAEALQWFAVIGAGDMVAVKKPAPDVYRWVLEQLGMTAGECLAFEDSRAGLHSALGAGVATVLTLGEYTRGESFDGALAVLDGLGEPGRPAVGTLAGTPWSGCVEIDTLRQWHQAAARNMSVV